MGGPWNSDGRWNICAIEILYAIWQFAIIARAKQKSKNPKICSAYGYVRILYGFLTYRYVQIFCGGKKINVQTFYECHWQHCLQEFNRTLTRSLIKKTIILRSFHKMPVKKSNLRNRRRKKWSLVSNKRVKWRRKKREEKKWGNGSLAPAFKLFSQNHRLLIA